MNPIINIFDIPVSVTDITTFIGLFVFLATVYFIGKQSSPVDDQLRAQMDKRIRILSKQQDDLLESGKMKRKTSTFSQTKKSDFTEALESRSGIIDKIKVLKKKAGINYMTLETFMVICLIGGLILSFIIVEFNFLNMLTGIPVGLVVGSYLAYSLLGMQAERKKMAFLKQFPEAIEMMIRGVKAGLNINRIMKLVSMEAQEPVAGEFTIITQKLELGVEPEKVFTEAADKIDLEEFRFLVVALILQMENGGMLGDILQNLADIVRKRLDLDLKIKAASAEARMSAIIISVLPFIFGGIMAFVNPSHIQEFFKPGPGKTLLKIMIVLFCIGSFLMVKATKIKV